MVLKRWSHSGPPVVIEKAEEEKEKEKKQVDGGKKKEGNEPREEVGYALCVLSDMKVC